MIDMHMHSVFSDGQYTPEELAESAYKKGIKIFSLTDHDTFAGNARAAGIAEKYGMDFIPGIELSTQLGSTRIHILGYNVDFDDKNFLEFHKKQTCLRERQKKANFEYLKKIGIDISETDVDKYVSGDITGRPHFAMALVEKGYAEDVKDAFAKYLATDEYKKIQLPKADTREAVRAVADAGGTAVIAHPVLVKASMRELDKIIAELKENGLRGIEAHYGKNTQEQTDYFCAEAKKYDLLVTGGSDFHGEKVKHGVELGTGENNSLFFKEYDYIRKNFLKDN